MFKKELSTFGRFIGMLLLYSYSGLALAEDTFQTSSVVGDMVADAGKNAALDAVRSVPYAGAIEAGVGVVGDMRSNKSWQDIAAERGRQALNGVPGGSAVGAGLDAAKDLKEGKSIKDVALQRGTEAVLNSNPALKRTAELADKMRNASPNQGNEEDSSTEKSSPPVEEPVAANPLPRGDDSAPIRSEEPNTEKNKQSEEEQKSFLRRMYKKYVQPKKWMNFFSLRSNDSSTGEKEVPEKERSFLSIFRRIYNKVRPRTWMNNVKDFIQQFFTSSNRTE